MIDMIDKKLKQKARGSRISCEEMMDVSLGKEGKAKSADLPERRWVSLAAAGRDSLTNGYLSTVHSFICARIEEEI